MKNHILLLLLLFLPLLSQAQQPAYVSIYMEDMQKMFETMPILERTYQKEDSLLLEVLTLTGKHLHKHKISKAAGSLQNSFSLTLARPQIIHFVGPNFSFHWLLAPGDSLEVSVDAQRAAGENITFLSISQYPEAIELLKGLQAQMGPYISLKRAMVTLTSLISEGLQGFEPVYEEMAQSHQRGIQFYDEHIAPVPLHPKLQEELKILAYFGASSSYGWMSFTQMFAPDAYERHADMFRKSKSFQPPFNTDTSWLNYTLYHTSAQTLFLNYTDRPIRTREIVERFEGRLMYELLIRNLSYACIHNQRRAERTALYDIIMDVKQNCPYPDIVDTLQTLCFAGEELTKHPVQANWSFEDATGKSVSLSKWKGKVVLIDIWATWCAPCKEEMKHLPTLLEVFEGEPFEVVALSLDKDREKWENYLNANETPYTHLHVADMRKYLEERLQISSIPRYLLIDKNGQLVEAYAYRPSNAKLAGQIEDLLQK